jgi:RNA 3'-terminal phosphate cyclase (ATP)
MADSSAERLRKDRFSPKIEIRNDEADHPAFQLPAFQPGAALTVWAETEKGCLLGSDLSGALGRPAERIGRQTANHLLSDLKTGAAVDRHTADQLIPLAALAKGESIINILEITDHIESRCWLAETILGARTRIEGTRLTISGIEYDRKT